LIGEEAILIIPDVTTAEQSIPQNPGNIIRHIEIKAYLDDYQTVCDRVAAIADKGPIDRVQNDTFFHCRSGRLKLRSSGQYHDLIYYRRENDYGPTVSFYQTARTKNPVALRTSLNSAFGESGRVKKFRRSYRVGRSVIHLDRVGGLGDFLEIKTELEESFDDRLHYSFNSSKAASAQANKDAGANTVENLMQTLGVDLFQLVDGAYVDLINERSRAGSNCP